MNNKELNVFTEHTFKECLNILNRKNKDYGDTELDVFKNLRSAESYGIGTVETAIFTKMSDKLSRIATGLKRSYDVKDETLKDSILDMINYSLLLLAYNTQKKENINDK